MAPKEILVGIIASARRSELVSQILSIPAARTLSRSSSSPLAQGSLRHRHLPDAWKAALDASSDPRISRPSLVNPPKFSEVVRVARRRVHGAHPADDLNGADVARKLTILARTVSAFSIADGKGSLPELQSYEDVIRRG
ncbi:hypothetical protein FA13DRAFT_1805951 [Coprinellus micaceus]|uniref:Homoserine dehydrogenase catalytic domain-containing protein n=1 Tax=Coprinellus micaceus TaxID=71717 RepID=A0A4Y7RTM0_COPMI|nr:hypothetical protein FA13DRAFT_1805951 [Coprinellus micaceus]